MTKLAEVKLTLIACLLLSGCEVKLRDPQATIRQLPMSSREALAQQYFAYGVTTACNIIAAHQRVGEPIPSYSDLLNECIAHDLAMSGTNTYLKIQTR